MSTSDSDISVQGTHSRPRDTELTADRVLEELRRVAFLDPRGFRDERGRLKPMNELTPDQAAALESHQVVHRCDRDESNCAMASSPTASWLWITPSASTTTAAGIDVQS